MCWACCAPARVSLCAELQHPSFTADRADSSLCSPLAPSPFKLCVKVRQGVRDFCWMSLCCCWGKQRKGFAGGMGEQSGAVSRDTRD